MTARFSTTQRASRGLSATAELLVSVVFQHIGGTARECKMDVKVSEENLIA